MWDAMISGPDDSPWEGDFGQGFLDRWHVCVAVAFFRELSICPSRCSICYSHFPSQWQQLGCARHVVFSDGMVCLDIIKDKWSPVNTVSMILTSIQVVSFRFSDVQSLLNDPNPASPANQNASYIYCHNREAYWFFVSLMGSYNDMVRDCVVRSWLSPAAVRECFPDEVRPQSIVPCFEDCLSQNTIHQNLLEVQSS